MPAETRGASHHVIFIKDTDLQKIKVMYEPPHTFFSQECIQSEKAGEDECSL